MAEICLEMAVKRQLVSLLIYGTPSMYLGFNAEAKIQIINGI